MKLRKRVGRNLVSHVVQFVSQIVIVKFMVGQEGHWNGTSVGIETVFHNGRVVGDSRRRNGSIEGQENQLG